MQVQVQQAPKQVQLQQNNNQKTVSSRMPKMKEDKKPRGRMTAYAYFVQKCREEHKSNHPEENLSFSDFSKMCSKRWKTLSEDDKKRFQELAEIDKKRYEDQMKDYTPPEGVVDKRGGKKRRQVKDPNAPKKSM